MHFMISGNVLGKRLQGLHILAAADAHVLVHMGEVLCLYVVQQMTAVR